MRRNAYAFFLPKQFPRAFDREVILPQMDAVRIDRNRNIGMIINDKQRPRLPGCPAEQKRCFVNIPSRSMLIAILEKPYTGCKRLEHGLLCVDAKQVLIKDQADAVEITWAVNCSAP
jgi:hypothetical protein